MSSDGSARVLGGISGWFHPAGVCMARSNG